MHQVHRLERLLNELHAGTDEAKVAAAIALFECGEHGYPAGTYLLEGAKAALRAWRLADAVVLTFHGLRLAEPNSRVWAELLVNRATACAQHGFSRDAVTAGEQFLELADRLSPDSAAFISYAHHAVGFAYDDLKQHEKAVTHYRLALEMHVDPVQRARASVDLAYALALLGRVDEADQVIQKTETTQDPFVNFTLAGATAIVRYQQQRVAEAVAAAESAEALAKGHEDVWAVPLAEIQYWLARAIFELGDRRRSARLALRVAIVASQHWPPRTWGPRRRLAC